MATTKREKLFTEFPPVSAEQWEEVIKADLKGADYERKLVWKTPEGFNVRPYYRAENLAGLKFLGSEAGVFPYVRGTRAHNRWKITRVRNQDVGLTFIHPIHGTNHECKDVVKRQCTDNTVVFSTITRTEFT